MFFDSATDVRVRMDESWQKYEWVRLQIQIFMSDIWVSKVARSAHFLTAPVTYECAWMSYGTNTNESCHTCKSSCPTHGWVMFHETQTFRQYLWLTNAHEWDMAQIPMILQIRISHVSRNADLWAVPVTYECAWMSHGTNTIEWCQKYEWVMSHVTRCLWRTNAHEWVMAQIRMSHGTNTDEWFHEYDRFVFFSK